MRRVSVVIPSRNRPDLLPVAVRSVLDQGGDLEVIVIDDGSDPPVAAKGLLCDPRVCLVRSDRPQGPTKARNLGLDLATGAYVAFLDDDDVWLPGKLRRCLAIAEAMPDVGVIAHRTVQDVREVDAVAAGEVRVLTEPLWWFGREQTPHLDGLLVRSALAKAVRFDETFDAAQDVDFVIELARRTPIAMVSDALAVRGPDAGTAVAVDRRIVARRRLGLKHADVLYADAASRSFYHLRLGHLHRRLGRRTRALGAFATAIRHRALYAAPWKAIGLTMLPTKTATRLSIERRIKRGRPPTRGPHVD